MMLPDKLNRLLIERREELLKELDAIEVVLNSSNSNMTCENVIKQFYLKDLIAGDNCEAKDVLKANYLKFYGGGNATPIEPKDKDTTWKNYLIKVIETLGGKGKTSDIANTIILSNKDLSFTKARQTAADILPELVEEGKLEVEKGETRKEGNTYIMKMTIYQTKNSRKEKINS